MNVNRTPSPLRGPGHVLSALGLALSLLVLPPADGSTLREAAGDDLLIGCPVGYIDLGNEDLLELIKREFNCITIETELMPFKLGVNRASYAFDRADAVLAWAEENNLPVFGHMLLWDYRIPSWLFQDDEGEPLPREQGLSHLREYIHQVMGRYRGRIRAWNVVNEAISDEPGEYLRDTAALRSIGGDYVEHAFAFAAEADPGAELYYNDYSVVVPEKRAKVLRLVRALRHAGLRVDAIGLQGHWMLDFPDDHQIDETIAVFAAEGLDVLVTELDIDVLPRTHHGANMSTVEHGPNPFPQQLPPAMQEELADRYFNVFERLLRHPQVKGINFWGSHDGRSWLNDFPVQGRTNHPLLFDRKLRRKPAHAAVLEAFAKVRAPAPAAID